MDDLPSGTITFLFTDIEGSTRRWEANGPAMSAALARHDVLLRSAFAATGGHVFKTGGDAFCVAFQTAPDALAAALAAQRALAAEDWAALGLDADGLRVRMGLHTGTAESRDGDYFGRPLNRVARLLAAGHGGQVLLSLASEELVRDDLGAGVGLLDLGDHRLKDLTRPERIFQLTAIGLPAAFPPLRSLDALAHNLPVQLTSFVGREWEMAEAKRLLGAFRLVTLTGIGGSGKTRLALQVAADLIEQFEHGVWFVDLAPIYDPDLVPQTVANVLGLRDEPGRSIDETLAAGLRSKGALIVLDNCEHVVAACAVLADRLLRSAPNVRILATSREPLAIAGETPLAVPPLAVPASASGFGAHATVTAASLAAFDAVRLFIERAAAVKPDFAVTNANAPAVAGICQRLDGIPLALELAAARVRMMPPEAILDRLSDRFRLLTGGSRAAPTRQQTLLAAVDWSHDLLESPEQALFRRLAAFRGGWTIEGAEAVCAGDGVDASDVFELLGRLVDKSLVIADDGAGVARFRWLETVRQYARSRLEAAGELQAVMQAHAEHFLTHAEAAAARFDGGDNDALVWFAVEHDNLRAVLDRMAGDVQTRGVAVRMAIALKDHWWWHYHPREGIAWGQRLCAAADGLDLHQRAYLQYVTGGLMLGLGKQDEGVLLLKAALDAFNALGDVRHASWCHNDLGLYHVERREYEAARAYFRDRLALQADDAPDWDKAIGLNNVAELEWYCGNLEAARARWEESRQLFERSVEEAGTPHVAMVDVLKGLGHLARKGGDTAAAVRLYRAGLEMARQRRGPIYEMRMLICFAVVAAEAGEHRRAGRLLGAVEAYRDHQRIWYEPMDSDVFDEAAAIARTALSDAAWQSALAEGRAMGLEAAVDEALAGDVG